MAKTFKVGDVVQLKSGGPHMTVAENRPIHASLSCIWFCGNEKCQGYFAEETLKAVEEKKLPRLDVCQAESPEGFLCTRDLGHSGEHIATGSDRIYETWE